MYYFIAGVFEGKSSVGHEAGDIIGNNCPDKIFAMAGTRYCTGIIGSISAGANDGCIADPAVAFIGHAPGGGSSGEVAFPVERYCAYSAFRYITVIEG